MRRPRVAMSAVRDTVDRSLSHHTPNKVVDHVIHRASSTQVQTPPESILRTRRNLPFMLLLFRESTEIRQSSFQQRRRVVAETKRCCEQARRGVPCHPYEPRFPLTAIGNRWFRAAYNRFAWSLVK